MRRALRHLAVTVVASVAALVLCHVGTCVLFEHHLHTQEY
jgi:hypothetical protein